MYEPVYWRDRAQNERFVGRECSSCGFVAFPESREVCKRCGEYPDWKSVQLGDTGVIKSYVVQQTLPDEFETPLPLAVLDVPQDGGGEPARVYGLFTETSPDDVEVGMEAETTFREMYQVDGLPIHSFKFTLPRGERL
jgi:uncharacterized OB-fold protein